MTRSPRRKEEKQISYGGIEGDLGTDRSATFAQAIRHCTDYASVNPEHFRLRY
jgi:hypothetical protein